MKTERVVIKTTHHESQGLLLIPDRKPRFGVILAHGAGGNMHADFISYFHQQIAQNGFACMKFNFPYSQAGRKSPDPQPVLIASYKKAIEAMPMDRVVIGGKSMGGRIASYVADDERVVGLLFLGYPLHPPGKPDQLRDQHLYSIRKPMFFASGTKDPFARMDLLKSTIARIGKASTLHLIPEGGHSFEVPKNSGISKEQIYNRVLEAIIVWLDSMS